VAGVIVQSCGYQDKEVTEHQKQKGHIGKFASGRHSGFESLSTMEKDRSRAVVRGGESDEYKATEHGPRVKYSPLPTDPAGMEMESIGLS
jgi:hypothetical protein